VRKVQRVKVPGYGTPSSYAVPSLVEARALNAFAKGDASPEHQKIAFNWILLGPCRAGKEVHVPGQPDSTQYLAGRLSVSLQIGWVLGQSVDAFRTAEED
jgi:hypothetical protein